MNPNHARGTTWVLLIVLLLLGCNEEKSIRDSVWGTFSRASSDSTVAVAIEDLLAQNLPDNLPDNARQNEEILTSFYEARHHRPAWVASNAAGAQAEALLDALNQADQHGLDPGFYDTEQLQQRLDTTDDAEALAELDVLLSAAFIDYASDLDAGRIDPMGVDQEWHAEQEETDYAALLASALERGNVQEALADLAPAHEGYQRLKKELARYQALAEDGDWPVIPDGDVLHVGDTSPRVPALRERLAQAGYLEATSASDSVYSEALAEAAYQFQQTNGLAGDSLLGPEMLAALNVPIEERIRTIQLNLERWRWLPRDLGERHVLVNVPAFKLFAYDENEVEQDMKVIVGAAYSGRGTTIFTDMMEYLVFSPYWNIPPGIANEEILPEARNDRDYLVRNNYEIVSHYAPDATVYDPYSTSLSRVASGELRLREKPGRGNSLGGVKFMFPNNNAIYLHDTPADHLFDRVERDFSHGCVRVERPVDLAAYALRDKPEWTRQRIESAMFDGNREQVNLDEPIPVYLLYFTAYVEEDGRVRFFRDLYEHDEELARAF